MTAIFVENKVNQGKDYAGYATFVLPDPEPVPEFIRGQDVEFVQRSDKSKFNQKQRTKHDGKMVVKPVRCGVGNMDSDTMARAETRSHMKGWASIDKGVHSVVGLDPNVTNDNLKFGGSQKEKQVSFDDFNDASLRWKYGTHAKNAGQVKGTKGVVQMSRDIIRSVPRGASVSGRYAGHAAQDGGV